MNLAGKEGLEPPTWWLTATRSTELNYNPIKIASTCSCMNVPDLRTSYTDREYIRDDRMRFGFPTAPEVCNLQNAASSALPQFTFYRQCDWPLVMGVSVKRPTIIAYPF